MIAVIFEVFLAEENIEEYLEIASELREQLKEIDGFISIERFFKSYRGREDPVTLILARRGGSRDVAKSGISSSCTRKRASRCL